MVECNTIVDSHNCAIQPYTCCGVAPSPEQLSMGIKPYDTLPAEWWNWLWNDTNTALAEAHTTFGSAVNEILTVLNDVGITPDSECTTQLKEAIYCLHRTTLATSSNTGTVKSSSVKGNIQINSDGTMIANGLGNAAYVIVDQINSVKSYHDDCISALCTSVNTKNTTQLRCICLGTGVSTIKTTSDHKISLGIGNAALCDVSDLATSISNYATLGGTVCCAACVGVASSATTATNGLNAVCRFNNCQCCVCAAYYVTTCPGTVSNVSTATYNTTVATCATKGAQLSKVSTATGYGCICVKSCGTYCWYLCTKEPTWVFSKPYIVGGNFQSGLCQWFHTVGYVNGLGAFCVREIIGGIRAYGK